MILSDLPIVMIRCLIITIFAEIILAIILRDNNKKDLLNILLVNILTNPIAVSSSVLINMHYGLRIRNICVWIIEVLVVFIEGLIYKKVLDYKKINPILFSLILNAFSYLAGELINRIIYN